MEAKIKIGTRFERVLDGALCEVIGCDSFGDPAVRFDVEADAAEYLTDRHERVLFFAFDLLDETKFRRVTVG